MHRVLAISGELGRHRSVTVGVTLATTRKCLNINNHTDNQLIIVCLIKQNGGVLRCHKNKLKFTSTVTGGSIEVTLKVTPKNLFFNGLFIVSQLSQVKLNIIELGSSGDVNGEFSRLTRLITSGVYVRTHTHARTRSFICINIKKKYN